MFDAIIIIMGAVLAMFSVAVLAYPLMKSRSRGQWGMPETKEEDGIPELDSIYESIRTLRLEYELGKIEENLYHQQISEYRLLAAAALRRRAQQADGALLVEQEVLMARATQVSTDGISADGNSAGSSGQCPSCGAALEKTAAQCPKCAVKLGLQGPELP